MTVLLYIGSDPKSHKLEMKKIMRYLRRNHSDFIVTGPRTAYWDNDTDEVAEIIINDTKADIRKTMNYFNNKLHRRTSACSLEDLKYFD